MNQYYNYKKWRLSRVGEQRPPIGNSRFYNSETPVGYFGYAHTQEYQPNNITKQFIDNNLGRDAIHTGGHIYGSDDFLTAATPHLNNLLSNLKYVVPATSLSKPEFDIRVTHGNPDTTYHKMHPSSFKVSSLINSSGLRRALSDYAGSIFHNAFSGYYDEDEVPFNSSSNTYNSPNHITPLLYLKDSLEENGLSPDKVEDIPEESSFHPHRIDVNEYSTYPERHEPPESQHRKNGTEREKYVEDMALVLAHRASEKYHNYLESGHTGTFSDYLKDKMHLGLKDREKIWHEFILNMVEGNHLPIH